MELPVCQNELCDWELLKQQVGSVVQQCSNDSCNENYRYSVGAIVIGLKHWMILIITIVVVLRLN